MRKYNYEDQEAKRYGRIVQATMIHHIYPLADYPMLALQTWNLLPLSAASHNKMHDRLTDEVTGAGLYWQQKRRRDFEKFFADKNLDPPPFTKIILAYGRRDNGSFFRLRDNCK
ncbi:HNH endonuclease [Lacticaseibacillus suibinensis]|uniref:HNH endonuclease n=1 Tax=Lacticaseibacillus suibinensis TaxID=2486011 RepID=UPI001780EEB4|nr:HNH endonuclease [Lacticaseibacillus suibinensis]